MAYFPTMFLYAWNLTEFELFLACKYGNSLL